MMFLFLEGFFFLLCTCLFKDAAPFIFLCWKPHWGTGSDSAVFQKEKLPYLSLVRRQQWRAGDLLVQGE